MSELVDRAKASLEGVDPYQPWEVDEYPGKRWGVYAADSLHAECRSKATAEFIVAARQLVPELIAVIEFLEPEVAHWKALWKGTTEYADNLIQERDEALRALEEIREKCLRWGSDMRLPQEVAVAAAAVIRRIGELG